MLITIFGRAIQFFRSEVFMIKKTYKALLFALCFLVGSQNQVCKADNAWVDGIAIAGVTLLAGAGIYKLVDWLTYRTDEQVMLDAQALCNKIDNNYGSLHSLFVKRSGIALEIDQAEMLDLLQEVASACIKPDDFESCVDGMRRVSGALWSELSECKKRLTQALKQSENVIHIHQLEATCQKLQSRHEALQGMMQFLEKHAVFFALNRAKTTFGAKYADVIRFAYQLPDQPYLIDSLAGVIVRMGSFARSHYLFLDFYDELMRDCTYVHRILNQNGYEYAALRNDVQHIYNWLHYLGQCIAGSPRYRLEMYYKKLDEFRREQERLERRMQEIQQDYKRALRDLDKMKQSMLQIELKTNEQKLQDLIRTVNELRNNSSVGITVNVELNK